MSPCRAVWLVAVLLAGVARAADPDPELVHAEKTLKDAGVATDGPALLRFFRERAPSEADRARLADGVRRLGDDDFDTREKATEELLRAGRKALPLLRPALRDEDAERARRAAQCVREIESVAETARVVAAARVLRERNPEGTAAALLAYLPGAEDEPTEDAVRRALLAVGVKDGTPDPALVRALTDGEPLRRAAAAHVLGRTVPGKRGAVRRLLTDADARVRVEAAEALVRGGDKEAVAALIALLGDGPMPLGYRAQELLYRLAADKSPAAALADEEPGKRAAVADAWRAWWKDAAPATDLARINFDETLQGINVICEWGGQTGDRVWACRADGKPLWDIKNVAGAVDVQVLANGRVLIAEIQGNVVTERDRTGKVLWTKTVTNPTSCRRLPNGNTFIATQSELMEVDPKGTPLYCRKNPSDGTIARAHLLPNGHILFANYSQKLVELDPAGKVLRTVNVPTATSAWTGVELLRGDRFLVSLRDGKKVLEVDAAGKVLWERVTPDLMSAVRLPNGNTLVAADAAHAVIEYDRAGKEVWQLKLDGRPYCVRRY